MDNNKKAENLVRVSDFLEENAEQVKNILVDLHPEDIAEILEELNQGQRVTLFRLLDPETAGLVLNELKTELVTPLLAAIGTEHTSDILDEMSSDDVADLLGELPEGEANNLLNLMELSDAEDVQELMDYEEDTAGGIMTTEFVAIRKDISAGRAIEVLRETAQEAETVYYVYVINEANQLVGVLSLRELIMVSPDTLIQEFMHSKVLKANVKTDQEEVARIVAKYDLIALPVVDDNNELLGIVTVDDVIDVIQEEATEDILRLAGTSDVDDEEDLHKKIFYAIRSRLPWLLVTLVSGILSGQIISSFEHVIQSVVALTFFIPLLTGMGGNIGTQSSTLMVRGMATGFIDSSKIWRNIFREAMVGLIIGFLCGVFITIVATWWQGNPMIGLIVGIAMWVNMTAAATVGTLVPLVFKRLGVDPAVSSAPFISTTVDNTGLIIYSVLTTLFLKFLV